MKKLFALLLVLALLVCAFSGCASKEEGIPTESKPVMQSGGMLAQMDLQALYDDSVGVFYGTIVKTKTYDYEWDLGDGSAPIETVFTDYTVKVEKVYKGTASGSKFVFHEEGGEGSKIIVESNFGKDYKIGYKGFFFLAHNGTCAPYFGVENDSLAVPSYITLPKELASKDGNTTFTVEQFGEILAGYAK